MSVVWFTFYFNIWGVCPSHIKLSIRSYVTRVLLWDLLLSLCWCHGKKPHDGVQSLSASIHISNHYFLLPQTSTQVFVKPNQHKDHLESRPLVHMFVLPLKWVRGLCNRSHWQQEYKIKEDGGWGRHWRSVSLELIAVKAARSLIWMTNNRKTKET